ncbi:predicted protein [Phaeodactylum tricornutum CCAP 1055/1]|jgi:hypothetical protein|uniref:Permease n=2 Tax=Phaeodactylum tricornutum TaxID=2850 RepID=B7G851_PHATC|nr:predicted protein [Phaeodactylum tricornutum CCAP 1055/1]EEC45114.1 predicted protein [Phaeodactylum tricornutum CCAP 1055/1]|eukprot:XP_002183414.1 predicted protein [Phaeodactylum tricornutum CCAP 1055/1]
MAAFLESWHEAAITSLGLFWTAFWAFALGYLISSMIQVFVTRKKMQELMGVEGVKSIALATFFGFVSSSCSFAALSGARSLFAKGAGLVPALSFLLASTNLVIELGIVIAVFLSWEFVVGEYVGGIILILLTWLLVHFTTRFAPVEEARQRALKHENAGSEGQGSHGNQRRRNEGESMKDGASRDKRNSDTEREVEDGDASDDDDHESRDEDNQGSMKPHKFFAKDSWEQVAMRYFMEWNMVWKDVTVGFTVAGIVSAFVPNSFFNWLFISGDDPSFWELLEECLVGPVAAFFTFIGSMGNIPLAAVLFENGVSFAGIMAFIFSDLVVIPIIRINAKYYGLKMALYILGVFLTVLVATALILYYVFDVIGILPSPESVDSLSERDFFELNYTFGLNIIFLVMSVGLFGWYFAKHGFGWSMGGTVIEIGLFWLALASYIWLIGGLLAIV